MDHDIARLFSAYPLYRLIAVDFAVIEEIKAAAIDVKVRANVEFSLRLNWRTSQLLVLLAVQSIHVVHVVDCHPFVLAFAGTVQVRGFVAEAILAEGESQSQRTMLVIVPILELLERKLRLWLHGHIENTGRHDGRCERAVANWNTLYRKKTDLLGMYD